jgi:hypothetical protein
MLRIAVSKTPGRLNQLLQTRVIEFSYDDAFSFHGSFLLAISKTIFLIS